MNRNSSISLITLFLCFVSLPIFGKTSAVEKEDNSIVQIKSTVQYPNFAEPWRYKHPETRTSYGVVIGENLVLTTAQTVYYQTNIEIQKFGSLKNFSANIVKLDPDLGLAILKVGDSEFSSGLKAVSFPSEVFLPSSGLVIEYQEYRNLSEKKIRSIKLDIDQYTNGYVELPYLEVQSDEKMDGIGELVVEEASRIPQGILIQFKDSSHSGKLIPSFTIKRFIESTEKNAFSYKGFRYRSLVDKTSREFYGVKKEDQGIIVAEIYPGTPASKLLKLEDVIVEAGGYKIDPKGYFDHPKYGKISLAYLFHSGDDLGFKSGKKIPLKIIRAKKMVQVQMELAPFPESAVKIPYGNTRYRIPNYIMLGGIVFQELTEHFLMEQGNQWRARSNKELLYLNDYHRIQKEESEEKVLLLSHVFPIPGNQAYHSLRQLILKSVNSEKVKNLADLQRIVSANQKDFLVLETEDGTQIVFGKEELGKLNEEAMKIFRIAKSTNL
ncbi:PDZ domain-containing protein [Leptospira idonii]|uniref:PDZ domain-containing protein n=1 Tax=Leptospira idonii TaxID=1193500 RepID=A0A4R9LYZ2_9LEPT|nr:PDZ domain-containing protein [Leptospira idonii]TGN19614.1 PDZ domain-containing protein [Leptospira idonii]